MNVHTKKVLKTSNPGLEDGEGKPSGPQQPRAIAATHDCSSTTIKPSKPEGLLEGPDLWFLYLTPHLLNMPSVGYKLLFVVVGSRCCRAALGCTQQCSSLLSAASQSTGPSFQTSVLLLLFQEGHYRRFLSVVSCWFRGESLMASSLEAQ